MTEKLAHRIALYFERQEVVESDKRNMLEYGIFHFLSSMLHIVFLCIAGILFSVMVELISFCLCFCSLKQYIGGAHAKKHWTCLWGFTLLATFSAISVQLIYEIGISNVAAPMASIVAFVVILLRAPVIHPNSPKFSQKKLQTFRSKAVMIASIQLLTICICSMTSGTMAMLALCGSMGSLAASISLLIPISTNIQTNEKEGTQNEK